MKKAILEALEKRISDIETSLLDIKIKEIEKKEKWVIAEQFLDKRKELFKVNLTVKVIETEPEYVITESFLKALCIEIDLNQNSAIKWIKEKYPDAFKENKVDLPLDYSGWAKSNRKGDELWMMCFENGYLQYGIDSNGNWFLPNGKPVVRTADRIATPEEVTEALTKEAVKRGFKEGVYLIQSGINKNYTHLKHPLCGEFSMTKDLLILEDNHGYGKIFENGKWAEILETISKEDAEQKYGIKILN